MEGREKTRPIAINLSHADHKMAVALGQGSGQSKQAVLRSSIALLHSHMAKARLDFLGL